MQRDPDKLEPTKEELLNTASSNVDLGMNDADSVSSISSNEQERMILIYQNDPNFRDLLLDFQKANWEECLKKIDQILVSHPNDPYLLDFKQDIEVRIKLQKVSEKHRFKDNLKLAQRWGIRALILIVVGLFLYVLAIQASNIYQANKLKQDAALTAQALAANYQSAENFMNAGKPEEALRLYNEIQQTSPSYQDVQEKIQAAQQAITLKDLYDQGNQALIDGQKDKAFDIFSKLDGLQPNYKDTRQIIKNIDQERQIAALVKDLKDAYSRNDSQAVVDKYEAIQAIDPSIDLPELKDILFNSYRNLIVGLAGRDNLTLKDIDPIEKYYRKAVSLIPQDKSYAAEREELQKIAVELLASKYYLLGLNLLESSNYSIDGLRQAVRVLTKANNLGPNSPGISTETENAQLFLNSYDDILHLRWDDAITNLEKLSRKDENYAGGRVKYFLYEAYMARGDLLQANADFAAAFTDYQAAEKYAWGDQGNFLRLFQIEVRIAKVLHKLGQDKDAGEFYHNIFDRLSYRTRLTSPDSKDLLNTLNQADAAYRSGNLLEEFRLYETAMKQADKLYIQKTLTVKQGDTLPNIAFVSGSSIDRIRIANQFGEGLVINKDQDIVIPLISTNGQ